MTVRFEANRLLCAESRFGFHSAFNLVSQQFQESPSIPVNPRSKKTRPAQSPGRFLTLLRRRVSAAVPSWDSTYDHSPEGQRRLLRTANDASKVGAAFCSKNFYTIYFPGFRGRLAQKRHRAAYKLCQAGAFEHSLLQQRQVERLPGQRLAGFVGASGEHPRGQRVVGVDGHGERVGE